MPETIITIAPLDPAEADQLGLIFFRAVREGAAAAYDEDQRRAWASSVPSGPDWAARLAKQHTLVARKANRPIGFMTLVEDGYIDLAFVDPDTHRRGVGRRLYAEIEALARAMKIKRLYSDASHLLRGLFEKQGWTIRQEQHITRAGITLTNFAMEKPLSDSLVGDPPPLT